MARALRPFLLLAAAIVFAVSGFGWSHASASTAFAARSATHHTVAGKAEGAHGGAYAQGHMAQDALGDHHHASGTVDPCTDATVCGEGHAHVGDTSSCCAMACHMALPTPFLTPSVTFLLLGRRALPPDTDGAETMTVRLDRPPKTSSLPVG